VPKLSSNTTNYQKILQKIKVKCAIFTQNTAMDLGSKSDTPIFRRKLVIRDKYPTVINPTTNSPSYQMS
jgi:hypothetical protein